MEHYEAYRGLYGLLEGVFGRERKEKKEEVGRWVREEMGRVEEALRRKLEEM